MGLKQPIYRELYSLVNKIRDFDLKGFFSPKTLKELEKLTGKLEKVVKKGKENLGDSCLDVFPNEPDFNDEERTYACQTGECLRHSKSPCKLYSCNYEKKRKCDTMGYLNRGAVDNHGKSKKIDVCPLFARYDPWSGFRLGDGEFKSCGSSSKLVDLESTLEIKLDKS